MELLFQIQNVRIEFPAVVIRTLLHVVQKNLNLPVQSVAAYSPISFELLILLNQCVLYYIYNIVELYLVC